MTPGNTPGSVSLQGSLPEVPASAKDSFPEEDEDIAGFDADHASYGSEQFEYEQDYDSEWEEYNEKEDQDMAAAQEWGEAAAQEWGEPRQMDSDDASSVGAPQRPTGAPGRPTTRRLPRRKPGAGAGAREGPPCSGRGREVVYIEHNYVHHHHHFHAAGSPGDLPPEKVRQVRAARAEISITGGSRRRSGRGGLARGGAGCVAAPKSIAELTHADPDTDFSAESLMCRDPSWAYSTRSTACSSSSAGQEGRPRKKLPLQDYLTLVSVLPSEARLGFSPYALPWSARRGGAAAGRRGSSTPVP